MTSNGSGFPRRMACIGILTICMMISPKIFGQQYDDIKTLKTKLTKPQPDSTLKWVYTYIYKYYSSLDNDSALIYAGQGLQHFRKSGDKPGQIKMLCEIGDFEDIHGNSQPAMENYLEAMNLSKSINDKNGMATTYNNMGAVQCKIGNYEKAIAYFIEAKKLFEAIGEKEGVFSAMVNIATLYDSDKDTAKAALSYKQAEEFSKGIKMSEYVLTLYLNIGEYYYDRNDTAKAMPYLRKVVTLSTDPKYITVHIAAISTLGNALYKYGKQTEGKKYLYEALSLAGQNKLPDMEASLLLDFAQMWDEQHIDTSLSYISKAVNLLKATGNKPALVSAYNAMATFYEKEKKFEDANKYLKLSHTLSDSLFNINKAKEIANIGAVYDLKLSNARVNELETLIDRNQKQRDVIIGIGLLIVVLLGIVLYFYQKTRKLNKNLKAGRKELVALNEMKDKLFSVIGHDLRGPIGNIPPILSIIEDEVALPDEHKQLLDTTNGHVQAVIETLDKLMLLGESAIRGKNYNPEMLNAKDSVNRNIKLVLFAADKKKITIANKIDDDVQVMADAGHFDFVIRNLLSNAIKFSFNEGQIEINASKNDKTGMVTFSVKDHGTGISTESLSHIFKSTVKSTYGTENEKGTGIGLKLCEEFVTLNGGKIWVESLPGEGSTFFFTLKAG